MSNVQKQAVTQTRYFSEVARLISMPAVPFDLPPALPEITRASRVPLFPAGQGAGWDGEVA